MHSPTVSWSLQADLLTYPSSISRTLSETVGYLETASSPAFASKTGNMDDAYEKEGRHIAIIDDLKSQLLQKDIALEVAEREKNRFGGKCEEHTRVVEAFEAAIREKDETIDLSRQDEQDRMRRSREDDARHKRELADLTMERDELLVSREELQAKLSQSSNNNRELVQRNVELKRTMELSADYQQRAKADPVQRPPETRRDFAPPASLPPQDLEEELEKFRLRNKDLDQIVTNFKDEKLEWIVKNAEGTNERSRLEEKISTLERTVERLNDENENYQVMMQQKTLNGEVLNADFMQTSESTISGKALASLADELEAADDEDDEAETGSIVEKDDKISQLQATVKRQTQTLKEQNQAIKDLTAENNDLHATKKAQTQYINNIITRILQFGDLQDVLNVNPDEAAKAAEAHKAKLNMQKELPAPPSGRSSSDSGSDRLPALAEGGIAGYIRRNMPSVRRSRPSSTVITPSPNQQPWDSLMTRSDQISPMPTPLPSNQNGSIHTAPSIPLPQGRGHRRTLSEQSNDLPTVTPAPAALVVNNMYRPSPPGSPGGTTNRTSYFPPTAMSRALSGISTENKGLSTPRSSSAASTPSQAMQPPSYDSSRNPSGTYTASTLSTTVYDSIDGDDAKSVMGPPRNAAGMTQYTSAVTTQKGMRPLRMVQEKHDVEAARKKANRQSWFGGMFGGKGT